MILPSLPGRWSHEGEGFAAAQLRLPAPHLFIGEASAYLFSAGGEHLLVDAGPREEPCWSALVEQLAEHHVQPADIGTVLVTHAHPDHYGSVDRFQASGARVMLHRLDLAFHHRRSSDPDGYRQRIRDWLGTQGVPESECRAWLEHRSPASGVGGRRLEPDVLLEGGEELRLGPLQFRVEWTPGHTPGHVIVWEDRLNLVLLGDHVLPTASPNIGIDPDLEGNPLPGYLESLRRLAARPGQVALPGHGHRFDLVARAQQLLAHQEDRAARVLAAVRDGARSAYEIRPSVWDDSIWDGLKGSLRVNAIRTLAAHLDRLASMGQLVRETPAAGDVWRPA